MIGWGGAFLAGLGIGPAVDGWITRQLAHRVWEGRLPGDRRPDGCSPSLWVSAGQECCPLIWCGWLRPRR